MLRRLASAALVVLVIAALPGVAHAAAPPAAPDFRTVDGHFYSQANGKPAGTVDLGYAITDQDGIPFWSAYVKLGGPAVLGYPISRRFVWDGLICQATQRGVLQWNPLTRSVQLANTMDHLSKLGLDDRLAYQRHVPRRIDGPADDGPAHLAVAARLRWLDADPRLRTVYHSVADPVALFGLPASPVADVGPALAIRLQRTALHLWKTDQPWAKAGQVTIANAGDLMKEVGDIPVASLETEKAPPPAPTSAVQAPSSRAVAGLSTWYGAYFQGRPMANGVAFDMWNPRTAAANAWPLGTRLLVTRVATGKSIVVTVTDRGAFRYPIVTDLSYAAFSQLADPDDGVIRVVVDPLD